MKSSDPVKINKLANKHVGAFLDELDPDDAYDAMRCLGMVVLLSIKIMVRLMDGNLGAVKALIEVISEKIEANAFDDEEDTDL